MGSGKLLRRVAYVVGGLIGLLLIVVIVLTLVRIPIDLTAHKGLVESTAGSFLNRTVRVDGTIGVTTSLWPVFQMDGLRIGNPEGFQAGDFARMKKARIQVSVLPLLLGKVHVEEFSVKGIAVTLLENKEGAVNWSSHGPEKTDRSAQEVPREKKEPEKEKMELTSDSFVLKNLSFEDISVSYQDVTMSEPEEFKIDECKGSALVGKPFALSMKGTLLNEPFTTTVEASSIQELLEKSTSWMDISTEIAETHFELEGDVDLAQALRTFKLKALVQGERLDSLDGLLGLDLPPLKSYGAGALLSWQKGTLDLSDFEVRVGNSKLIGKGVVDATGSVPTATVELTAPMIQLSDFDVGEWSPEEGEPEETEKADVEQEFAELFSPEVLSSLEGTLKISAEEVLSGKDNLGSGTLIATLNEGRFSLDPIKLNLPGGSLFFALSIKPGDKGSEATVRAVVENFDFGVLARRAKPDTDMGGTINVDVDLKSTARNLDELLANAKGYFDFSGHPVNLHAGIVDLWAVNLIAAIASRGDDKGSKINCVVGRWSMRDGLLQPDTFVIDTTKIRICGTGYANFKKEEVNLTVAPTAKKPEYFSLATPAGVRGNFDDFELGIRPGGVLTTAISFITSPVHTTLRRMVGDTLSKKGEDICGMVIGPDNRPTELPQGCRHLQKKKK